MDEKLGKPYFINILETRDDNGDTFLHLSVMIDNVDLVKYFISKNVNLNMKNKDGDSPLHVAVKKKVKTEVKIFLGILLIDNRLSLC